MKLTFLIALLFTGLFCKANMSSPLRKGTMMSAAISSKNISILSETIHIKIDKAFKTAKFIIEYSIQSDVDGKQIPLLFYAQDYKDSFFVWVDNRKVNIQHIPEEYTKIENSPFSDFSNSITKNNNGGADEITIYWYKNSGNVYHINDLKYFETDINKGIHTIRVEYTANVWTDLSGWVKENSFRYSLTPAKFWKSFGKLDIVVEQEGQMKQLTTNLGLPDTKPMETNSHWSFNKLPGEFLEFSYTPKPGKLASIFLAIEPLGLAILTGIILFAIQVLWIIFYRKNNLNKKYSIVVIVGSLAVPFLILLSYMMSYDFIDHLIGEDASRRHGYVFLVMILYPLILPFYWTLMWLIDRQLKRKLMAK